MISKNFIEFSLIQMYRIQFSFIYGACVSRLNSNIVGLVQFLFPFSDFRVCWNRNINCNKFDVMSLSAICFDVDNLILPIGEVSS